MPHSARAPDRMPVPALQVLTFFESVLAKGFTPAPAEEELRIEHARQVRREQRERERQRAIRRENGYRAAWPSCSAMCG